MDELKAMIQKMDTIMNQMKQDIDAARQNLGFQDQTSHYQDQKYRGKDKYDGRAFKTHNKSDKEPVVRNRRGQEGHVQYGCRVRLYHKRDGGDLNFKREADARSL